MFTDADRILMRRIDWRLAKLLQGELLIMATIQELQAEVAAVKTVEDSAEALIAGLAQQLKDALAQNDPAAIQAVIDSLESSKTALAQAVAENTTAPAG